MDRQKLSKVVLEHLRQREHENRGWQAEAKVRLSRWAGRFGALASWEKLVIAGAALLIVMGIPAAIIGFSGGDGGDDAKAVAPGREIDEYFIPTATPYTRSDATPRPIGVGGSPPVAATPTLSPEEINREDCDAIAGTPYQSEEEQLWYIDNCDQENDDGDGTGNPPSNPPTNPPSQPPTNPPPAPTTPPQQGLTASQAVSLGAQFLSANEPKYSVSAGNCSATNSGSFWTVSCNASLLGCTGGICQTTLRACVFEQPLLVDYC